MFLTDDMMEYPMPTVEQIHKLIWLPRERVIVEAVTVEVKAKESEVIVNEQVNYRI